MNSNSVLNVPFLCATIFKVVSITFQNNLMIEIQSFNKFCTITVISLVFHQVVNN
jgi:hypothetical protein